MIGLARSGLAAACLVFMVFAGTTRPAPVAAQDIPDTSVEAIRAYADGAEAYLGDPASEDALAHFRRAHELDPTFFTPVFMQFVVARNLGDVALADSLEAVLQHNRDRMSGYYQSMFDAMVLRGRALFAASEQVLQGVVERYPGTKAAYNYANYVWQRDPEAALRALEQLDPDREPIRGWFGYWSIRAGALHAMGELEGGLENAREAQRRHPDRLAPVAWPVTINAALGNVQQVEEALAHASAFPGAVLGLGYRDAGQELVAHGHEVEGRAMLERALAWFDEEDERTSAAAASQRAYTLYLLGRHADASDAYRKLAEAAPATAGYQAFLAVTSALAGDRPTAETILARVQRGEIGANWRARASYELTIHAALGDVPAAKRALKTYGLRALWVHRDPTLVRALGNESEFQRFLAAGN
jgi:tetratricopeptide (TPR) repeat protein